MTSSFDSSPGVTGGPQGGFPRPFGKYTLLAHLAVGGMADVFLAHQRGPEGFEKECVIKRILPHLGMDREFVQMFLDEARIAARLTHPHIVQIFDLGKEGGDYFLAMEYVDGINLEQLLEAAQAAGRAAVPWPVALRIIADVAGALDYAHNSRDSAGRPLGLVHRDVSPSNIMVGWGGSAKILDFGIAKAVGTNLKRARTEVGTIKGKIPYMSPEQLQGLRLDGRSDVFSLGVILYEITCGSRPFPAETAAQLTMQILHDEPHPPELKADAYPPGLRKIVMRALAKRPEDRWQSAKDFKLALEGLLAEQHVACTAYDVEAYLREVVPAERRRRLQVPPAEMAEVTGTEQTEVSLPSVGRVATPVAEEQMAKNTKPERPGDGKEAPLVTGLHQGPSLRLADLGQTSVDEEEDARERRPQGSGALTAVIVVFVLATVAGLWTFRNYEMGKGNLGGAVVDLAPAPDLSPPPAPDLLPARPAVVTPPPRVEKPPVAPPPPRVEKPPVKKPEVKKPEVKHRPPPKEKEPEAPVQLPRLPTPPPPDPE